MTAGRRPKPRRLSEEEIRLWRFAMRDTKILKRTGGRAEVGEPDGEAPAGRTPDRPLPADARETAPVRPAAGPPRRAAKGPPSLAGFERRQARQLARGQAPIDARLDLHGLRQREAHAALRAFLRKCQAQGHRHVLVITGKGSRREEAAEAMFYEVDRGVLRRLVPDWLHEPEFREMVVSYTESHAGHGGEGALYVRLRRMRAH